MTFTAGQRPGAGGFNNEFGVTLNSIQTASGTTTSTTYTATLTGGVACAVVFVAPTSGKVLIHNTLRSFTSTTGFVYCSIEVRTGATPGSGTVVQAAADSLAHLHQTNVQAYRFGVVGMLTGLVAGDTYNARQLFRVSTGTGTYLDKELIIQPTT